MTLEQNSNESAFRSGFVAIVGLPNAGKSTFVNAVIGQKITIVSHRPQTTWSQIRGILNGENFQATLIDTPGIHDSSTAFNQKMVRIAYNSLGDVDLVLFFSDASNQSEAKLKGEQEILNRLKTCQVPVALVLNKIDLKSKDFIARQISEYSKEFNFCEIFPISSLKRVNLDSILKSLPKYLPEGEPFYDKEAITDQTERAVVPELIREQIFTQIRSEIPYNVLVEIDSFKEQKEKVSIYANIHTGKESQKKILIGEKGKMIKLIGSKARKEIEKMTGKKVRLDLNVKVSNIPHKMLKYFDEQLR